MADKRTLHVSPLQFRVFFIHKIHSTICSREKHSEVSDKGVIPFSFSKKSTNNDNVIEYRLMVCGLFDRIDVVYTQSQSCIYLANSSASLVTLFIVV